MYRRILTQPVRFPPHVSDVCRDIIKRVCYLSVSSFAFVTFSSTLLSSFLRKIQKGGLGLKASTKLKDTPFFMGLTGHFYSNGKRSLPFNLPRFFAFFCTLRSLPPLKIETEQNRTEQSKAKQSKAKQRKMKQK